MEGKAVYVVAAKRTPIGSIGSRLAKLRGPELAQVAITAAMKSINLNPE